MASPPRLVVQVVLKVTIEMLDLTRRDQYSAGIGRLFDSGRLYGRYPSIENYAMDSV